MDEKIKKLIIEQEKAEKQHIKHKKQSVIAASVGMGKAKIAINIISKYPISSKIVFTAPREIHLQNFKSEMIKFGLENRIKHIHFCCIASLKKYEEVADLIVIDECHLDNKRSTNFVILQKTANPTVELLGLTGTPGTIYNNELLKILPISYSKFTDDAVKDSMLNDYTIHVIKHKLSTENNIVVKTAKNSFTTSEAKKYSYLEKKYNSSALSFSGGKFPFELMAIKQFFSNLKSKEKITKYVINKIKEKGKILVYCGCIEQCSMFYYPSYHSKLDKTERLVNFNNFKKEDKGVLTNVNGIKEAVSVPNLKYGIIMKIDASKQGFTQAVGRFCRLSVEENAHIYVLVAENTIEEKWFQKASSNINPDKIKYYHYDKLKK